MTPCYVIGAGIHTGLGKGLEAHVAALRDPPPPTQSIPVEYGKSSVEIPCHLLTGLPFGDAEERLSQAIDGVMKEALQMAGLTPREIEQAALIVGTSSLDISVSEAIYRRQLAEQADAEPMTANILIGDLADKVRHRFGIKGQDLTISTACTASANAIIHADRLVRSGIEKHVVVLGVEVLNLITALGFNGLELLTPTAMKPFDRERNGLVLGEGCSALVLGPKAGRLRRFSLAGSANLCDTYSISTANPDGSTIAHVIRGALEDAGLQPSDIAAIKTHGTASLMNDESEAAGIHMVFDHLPPICALKPFVGHTFGACGLNEFVMIMAAASEGFMPGTPGTCRTQSDLGICLTQRPEPLTAGAYLLNYFGFGGNNTALVLAHEH